MSDGAELFERMFGYAPDPDAVAALVVCDTENDYTDFPVYVMPADRLSIVKSIYQGKNGYDIHEVIQFKPMR